MIPERWSPRRQHAGDCVISSDRPGRILLDALELPVDLVNDALDVALDVGAQRDGSSAEIDTIAIHERTEIAARRHLDQNERKHATVERIWRSAARRSPGRSAPEKDIFGATTSACRHARRHDRGRYAPVHSREYPGTAPRGQRRGTELRDPRSGGSAWGASIP